MWLPAFPNYSFKAETLTNWLPKASQNYLEQITEDFGVGYLIACEDKQGV
jgi:hypothetical protein